MVSKFDKLKWNLYQIRKNALFMDGVKKGLIQCYEKSLIENLREVYYGEDPASIILLSIKMCEMMFGSRSNKKETIISGDNDVSFPMFRNYTGYKAEIEDGKVKKLTAHYYYGNG